MMTNQPVNRDEVERCPDCEHDDQSAGAHKGTTEAVYKVLTYGCNEQNPDCNSYCNCKNAFHFEAPRATLPAPVAKCVSCGHTIGVDAEGRCNQRLGYLGDVQPNLCPCWCEFPPARVEDEKRKEIRERRARVSVPTPWRWGCWSTTFGDREPAEMLNRLTLEHAPEMLQFSAGVRDPNRHPKRVLQLEEPLDNYGIAEFLANAPTDIDYLLDRLSQAEAERDAYARANDEFGWLDICEFCEKSISEGDGTFNVCGRCWNKEQQRIAQLTAQVESVRRETTIHARRAAEEISSFARRALNGDCPTKQSMEAIIINHFEAAATEGKSRV